MVDVVVGAAVYLVVVSAVLVSIGSSKQRGDEMGAECDFCCESHREFFYRYAAAIAGRKIKAFASDINKFAPDLSRSFGRSWRWERHVARIGIVLVVLVIFVVMLIVVLQASEPSDQLLTLVAPAASILVALLAIGITLSTNIAVAQGAVIAFAFKSVIRSCPACSAASSSIGAPGRI